MKTLFAGAFFVVLFSGTATAGPPLICHPIDIGKEPSLPWSATAKHWDARDAGYDRSRLVADTLVLLKPETPVIVRMETLRRAAIYADRPSLAVELADSLVARAKAGNADGLAAFDAGYFIESTHQLAPMRKTDPLVGRDGYTLAKQSLAGAKDPAAIEYGLALMIGRFPNEHFRESKSGGTSGLSTGSGRTEHGNVVAASATLSGRSTGK